LLRIIIPEKKDRLLFAGLVIISANAGGAWSPIGDVTTTMLWIGGQINNTNYFAQSRLFFGTRLYYQQAGKRKCRKN
jgi:Na+/H+ antiporter NhaD/arsenite permease-like protein